mmetsp:Transcript_1732/g.4047  ORF Transcript_1732/g.4047 Transcript_1732/m.4047 type:complete len:567 (-) Transcript_1732:171-1871(-)
MLFLNQKQPVPKAQRSLSLIEESQRISFLSDPPDHFTPENLLADELKKLTYDDRNEIEEELHGVGCRATNETPQLIEMSLAVFDDQVNKRKENDPYCTDLLRNIIRCWPTPAANGSHSSKCYLNDKDVRLRFLRCERFDVDKAVQRFVDFLEFMSELFGDYVTERPVRLSDFTKEEEMCLMQSRNQFLPFRDRSGRRVFAGVGNCNFHLDFKLRHKIFMYLFWVVSEDVETQIKGSVILSWTFDEESDTTWETKIRKGVPKALKVYYEKQNRALPVRIASWQHYYPDTPYFRFMANTYTYSFVRDSPYRNIFKLHFGSDVENKYKLAGYGVPVELLPMSSTGTMKYDNHRDFLNVIRAKSAVDEKYRDEILDCPRCNDVVYRKGPASKHNTGNNYYRELIEDYSLEHFTGDRNRKYELTMLVIQKVEARGGRFLEWKNMWVVYRDHEAIRKKIASAFKQYNRSRKKGETQQLVRALEIATAIGEEFSEAEKASSSAAETFVDSDDSSKRSTSSVDEFFFIPNTSTKRRRLSNMRISFNGDGNDGGCWDVDDACFGKCFFPTDLYPN